MDKTKVIETLDQLPNEFTTEELIDKLLFIDKVERGMKDVEEGRVLTKAQVKDRIAKKWSR